jgi:hypothetical protein
MDPMAYRVKLIELAYQMAMGSGGSEADILRRFRTIYRHMAATVDGAMAEAGFGPFGPMGPGFPGMQAPDTGKLLDSTEKDIDSL